MKKGCTKIYEIYAYIIPTVVSVFYIVWIVLYNFTDYNIKLLQDSKGFEELCKALLSYTSILLGVYGFFVPVIIGKMDEKFSRKFWKMIDKNKFTKDNLNIFLTGIIIVLTGSVLLLKDIMNIWVTNILIIVMIWNLLFFSCSIYRFVGIFIKLIMGDTDRNNEKQEVINPMDDNEKEKLRNKMQKF